jgi:hypothetical protein
VNIKWLITIVVMLTLICTAIAVGRRSLPPPPRPAKATPDLPGHPSCRGTILSIQLATELPSTKPGRHEKFWIVTVRPDVASGGVPGANSTFKVHSPSMSGFRKIGEHVEVYSSGSGDLSAIPCPM